MKSLDISAPDEIMCNSLLDGVRVSLFDVEHAECHDPLVLNLDLLFFERTAARRHEAIVQRGLFDAEHDELNVPLI